MGVRFEPEAIRHDASHSGLCPPLVWVVARFDTGARLQIMGGASKAGWSLRWAVTPLPRGHEVRFRPPPTILPIAAPGGAEWYHVVPSDFGKLRDASFLA
jgi:hypothetical protein